MDSAGRVWQVRASVLVTPMLAAALLLVVVTAGEIAARSTLVRRHLGAPSVGSPSPLFELQLAKLDALVEREGGIDCIFLGNSLVLFGLDPDAVDVAYAARTVAPLRSFNFGVGGITVSSIAAIARILVEDYHPKLIIYGITVRDFNATTDAPAIEATPWVRYRLGMPSVEGWLTDHSYAYRYFLRYAWRSRPGLEPGMRVLATGAPRGFYAFAPKTVFDAAALVRAEKLVAGQLRRDASPEQRAALVSFFRLRDSGVQLVILEMPIHLDPSLWPQEAIVSYRHLLAQVQQAAQASAALFWWTIAPELLPADGWVDLWHLNGRGANIFSRWLGERLAAAVQADELNLPSGGRPQS